MERIQTSYRVLLTTITGIVLGLHTMCVFAAGNEGAALVEPVRWIVAIVLVTFITLVVGGGLRGAMMTRQGDESTLKAITRGMFKGLVAFLIVSALAIAGLTILGVLWIAYSFLDIYVLSGS